VFFSNSRASREAGSQLLTRVSNRSEDRDKNTSWQTRLAQYDAVRACGQPNHSLLQRVAAIDQPVFIANGDCDPMILPHYSFLLAGLIPQSRVKICPDAAPGFLFQHHAQYAADIEAFLADPG
jgi:pimeloyl-ACP methyl ester carboxylesterase